MRCFEAMGCGSLLVSDAGSYPEGMQDGVTMQTYETPEQAARAIVRCLQAARGRKGLQENYSKAVQWAHFVDLAARIKPC
jgi:hypothetical protein